jgi:asparagine synthase (glutamine-hydrolysing)
MCGICGYLAKDARTSTDPQRLGTMLHAVRHRGPDDSGTHVDADVALGQVRLSIIDLAGGHQPIFNEDGTKCIILNGEIYNYLELHRQLVGRGHVFKTKSDTEVILHLYEDEGEDCVRSLHGMFAFVIWDAPNRTLFLARDRLGKKPIYYKDSGSFFAFSSEVKALMAAGFLDGRFNARAVDEFLAFNYTIGPDTAFADVQKLMPGHRMTVSPGGIRASRYWDFADIEPATGSFEECYERTAAAIDDSVKVRLMSEVPLGAYLSGGVDSSLIVAIMTKLTQRPVKTFTVGYDDAPEVSELGYARTVAEHVGAEHHEFILKPATFVDTVDEVVWHMDEPMGDYTTIPLLLISRLAKEHVTVMLSGEGADEVFAGYSIYRYMDLVERYRSLPRWLRRGVGDPLLRVMLADRKEGKYADWPRQRLEERYRGNGSCFTDTMRARLINPEFTRSLADGHLQRTIDSYYRPVQHKDPVSRMLYLDTKTWLPEDPLLKADKMTMAASIELRVPFLDHRLVELGFSLPTHMKIRGRQGKYIMKRYAATLLPDAIVHRAKRGFPVPVKRWMHGALGQMAKDVLLDGRTRQRGILNAGYLESLFQLHESGREDYSKQIWSLLVLETWLRRFIDESGRPASAAHRLQQ